MNMLVDSCALIGNAQHVLERVGKTQSEAEWRNVSSDYGY